MSMILVNSKAAKVACANRCAQQRPTSVWNDGGRKSLGRGNKEIGKRRK